MSATACALLRHYLRPRWIGDVRASLCETCGCLHMPDHPTATADPRPGARPGVSPRRGSDVRRGAGTAPRAA